MSHAHDPTWRPVRAVLDAAVADGTIPGWALCVRSSRAVDFAGHGGRAELRPRSRPVAEDQPWDLASLTKVLATTPLCLALVADGTLSLDSELQRFLPGVPAGLCVRHCLSHSSGLPPWAPLYEDVLADGLAWGSDAARERVVTQVLRTQLTAAPGTRHAYSDLGMLLLGRLLEVVGGDRLDRLWEPLVRRPSGADLRWGWPGAAATEDCPLRRRVIVGEVHDLNAAVMGGIAAHAGLFGSASAVAAFAAWQLRAWQGSGEEGLDPDLQRRAWSAPGPGSHHLGWDGVSQPGSTAGARWPADGVGHLGFTGASLWVAPRQDVIACLCTNRVHPTIEGGALPGQPPGPRTQAFRALRPAVHDAVVDALAASGRWPG